MTAQPETDAAGAPASFEKQAVGEDVFLAVLRDAVAALRSAGVEYGLIGGLASAIHGRPRYSRDVDLMIRPVDARRALAALREAGFATQETFPDWLYKGARDGVVVDLIFRIQSNIYLDEEMLARRVAADVGGCELMVLAPEDLLLTKATSFDEATPHYWYDALALLGYPTIDWDYLLRRGALAPRRLLALLVYADSTDTLVPAGAIRTLFAQVYAQRD